LESCRNYFETDRHFFVHANYKPDVPLDRLDIHTLRWLSWRDYVPPSPRCSGKVAIVGHTPQPEVLDLGDLKCLDTNCCYGGWLTALDVDSGQLWQVDEKGEVRTQPGVVENDGRSSLSSDTRGSPNHRLIKP